MAVDPAAASAYSTCCRYRAYAVEYEALVCALRSGLEPVFLSAHQALKCGALLSAGMMDLCLDSRHEHALLLRR